MSYLWLHLLSHISKGTSGVNILPVDYLGDVDENERFSMDESVEDVFLQSLVVVLDVLSLANFEGVVAVREDDGRELMLVVEEVTTMKVRDGHLVLSPERQGAEVVTNLAKITTITFVDSNTLRLGHYSLNVSFFQPPCHPSCMK